jgi:hypothetical protein
MLIHRCSPCSSTDAPPPPFPDHASTPCQQSCRVHAPTQFAAFAANFYSNLGNYKSFGDTKFIPELPKDRFLAILQASPAWGPDTEDLWAGVGDALYRWGGGQCGGL